MDYLNYVKNITTPLKINKEMDCLTTISLSVSNHCNKACSYCPHGNGYTPDANSFMSIETATKISCRLKELNKPIRLTISGMGEPFLNNQLKEILNILSEFKPNIITNGSIKPDWYDTSEFKTIVSIHDIKEKDELYSKWNGAIFRNHDINDRGCELHVTNRNDFLNNKITYSGQCYCMYYKMAIDYDGTYLKCADSWKRYSDFNCKTVYNTSIKEWFSKDIRSLKYLMLNGRENIDSCKYCDIKGTLIGEEAFEWYSKNSKGKSKFNI